MSKVKLKVPTSLTIGGVRYNSGEQMVEGSHAVSLLMLEGMTKADALRYVSENSGESKPKAVTPEPTVTQDPEAPVENSKELPMDMPHYSYLDEAGIHTFEELAEVNDLTDIDGIGKGRAKEISKWLDQNLSNSEG